MLEQLSLSNLNSTVMGFVDAEFRKKYEFSPAYQRPSVWDDARRRDLLRSMFMGLPIGIVILNHRGYGNQMIYGVIDGKQRLEALVGFYDNDFGIPADWFDPKNVLETVVEDSVELVYYSGLSAKVASQFLDLSVPITVAKVAGIPAEAFLFRLINSGGVAQTESTMENALSVELG